MNLSKNEETGLNVFSKEVQTYLDENKLRKNEAAQYRLLNGKVIDGIQVFNSVVCIPLHSMIIDPELGPVEVGFVEKVDRETKMPVFKVFNVIPVRDGNFAIRASLVSEAQIYEALELSSYNKSNPFRDEAEEMLFERIDAVKESKEKSRENDYLVDSLLAIREMDYSKMRITAAGYGINTQLPQDVLKRMLQDVAKNDPKSFIESIDSQDLEVKSVITMGEEAGVIKFSQHENKWSYTAGDEPIVVLPRKDNIKPLDAFAAHLKDTENGPKIKANIEKRIAAKNKKKD